MIVENIRAARRMTEMRGLGSLSLPLSPTTHPRILSTRTRLMQFLPYSGRLASCSLTSCTSPTPTTQPFVSLFPNPSLTTPAHELPSAPPPSPPPPPPPSPLPPRVCLLHAELTGLSLVGARTSSSVHGILIHVGELHQLLLQNEYRYIYF